MDLVNQLIKEKESLLKRVEAINILLESYGALNKESNNRKLQVYSIPPENVDLKINIFPKEARKDKQILWIFENKVKTAIKLSELQDIYNELRGLDENNKEVKIINIARRLKSNNKLAVVKYNKQNKSSFWGLTNWINNTNTDFKNEFRPNENLLPIDIYSTEVVTGE